MKSLKTGMKYTAAGNIVIVSKDVIINIKTEGVEYISLGDVTIKGIANPIEVYKLS